MTARLPVGVRRSIVGLLALAGLLALLELAVSVLRLVVWRTRWQAGIDAFRWYNKKVENPAMLKMGGRRITAIRHAGRSSGREYVTPVWAERSGPWFFIQLPYGANVDWCRNILAAGHCTLERDGVRYETTAPELVPAAEALPFLPAGLQRMQQRARVESYLRLAISQAVAPATRAG